MNDQQKWTDIDDFLLGRMSPSDRQAFEDRMSQDSDLQKKVELQRKLIAGMREYKDRQDFFSILKNEEAYDNTNTPTSSQEPRSNSQNQAKIIRFQSVRRGLAVAASIAVLILAWFVFRPDGPSSELAREYFSLMESERMPTLDGMGFGDENERIKELMDQGIQGLRTNNTSVAYDAFLSIQNQTEEGTYAHTLASFYLGQIALSKEEYAEAEILFTAVQANSGLPIESDNQYYLALSLIGQDKYEPARSHLASISSNYHNYNKVEQLLNILK
jgi:TolA-binding protein